MRTDKYTEVVLFGLKEAKAIKKPPKKSRSERKKIINTFKRSKRNKSENLTDDENNKNVNIIVSIK